MLNKWLAKLCYVTNEGLAYFTTQKLSDQWGDDWDDIPYEWNAGTPYIYDEYDREAGKEPWKIIVVKWEGNFDTPQTNYLNTHDNYLNSPWSVRKINEGEVPWLQSSEKGVFIYAGTTLKDFIELIEKSGGAVALIESHPWINK